MEINGAGAVVTGGGAGIGRAIAVALAESGARVVVSDIDADAARATAEAIGGWGVVADSGSMDDLEMLVHRAGEILGGVDAWFGNAGIDRGWSLTASEADWDLSHQVNVMAHVRAARLLVPRWVGRGGGRFVITASAAGLLTMLDSPTYAVSKHGAVAFAEWLSATYRHHGVVVQVLCPQGVSTSMLDRSGDVGEILRREGVLEPDDVAMSVLSALEDDRFLILPHPEVRSYARRKADDVDRWLVGMNRIQQGLDARRR